MPRVRLDIANEKASSSGQRPDIRIDTDVFAVLSGERTATGEPTPTVLRWFESWQR